MRPFHVVASAPGVPSDLVGAFHSLGDALACAAVVSTLAADLGISVYAWDSDSMHVVLWIYEGRWRVTGECVWLYKGVA